MLSYSLAFLFAFPISSCIFPWACSILPLSCSVLLFVILPTPSRTCPLICLFFPFISSLLIFNRYASIGNKVLFTKRKSSGKVKAKKPKENVGLKVLVSWESSQVLTALSSIKRIRSLSLWTVPLWVLLSHLLQALLNDSNQSEFLLEAAFHSQFHLYCQQFGRHIGWFLWTWLVMGRLLAGALIAQSNSQSS